MTSMINIIVSTIMIFMLVLYFISLIKGNKLLEIHLKATFYKWIINGYLMVDKRMFG